MTMIERVARALAFESLDPQTRVAVDMDKHFPFVRDFYMAQARAAILALREPTKEMCSSGDERCGEYGCSDHRMREIFRSMIDAALSETSGDKS